MINFRQLNLHDILVILKCELPKAMGVLEDNGVFS